MSLPSLKTLTLPAAGAAFALALTFATAGAPAQSNPFAELAGAWSGTGNIVMSNGEQERIRCRASYAVRGGGGNLQQTIRCASDSYRFDLQSDLVHSEGRISGNWTETNRNAGGHVTGRITGDQIQALVEGTGFSATVAVTTRADRQTVVISPRGLDVTRVQMSLRKSS